jgi:hypothetical protein
MMLIFINTLIGTFSSLLTNCKNHWNLIRFYMYLQMSEKMQRSCHNNPILLMDTLYCLILEQIILEEWYQVIGESAGDFTKLKYTGRLTNETVLYQFVRENIGIVPHLAPKKTWLLGVRATKFDALVGRLLK